MKNYPYNTGRTVTISLDTLGNADILQLFTIVTAGTNNVFASEEPDADPRADANAATEILLHVAETADDRAAGYCDAGQRHFLEDAKREYEEIFGTDPADDLRKRLEEEAETITRTALSGHEYTAANIDLAEAVAERNACPVTLTADDDARELRATGTAAAIEDFFAYCKEAAAEEPDAAEEDARTGLEMYLDMATQAYLDDPANENLAAALEGNAIDTNNDPDNLYRAGVFAGLAEAAAWGIYSRPEITEDADDINAITAAVYRAYGVAW